MTQKLLLITGIICLSFFLIDSVEGAPSTGTIQVAFILSQFENQEYQSGHDQNYFEDLAFGETDSMWDYYDEVSRSQLNIEGDVYGPYTLDGDAEDYGDENLNFVRDSIEIADDDIYYPDYHAVMVIHSGPGQESTGNDDDIWSIHWPSANIDTDDDYTIGRITQAPEYQYDIWNNSRKPLGVWVHEFGHELGLPDLYDTDYSSEGIGRWGVMASGSWTDNGETPAYFSAWCRYWLGWINPVLITDDINNLVMEPIEDGGNVYMLPIPGHPLNSSGSGEYFLIENRQQMKYDLHLPGEGLLIWHIDEDVIDSNWNSNSVNNDEEHKGVDLEEADGNDDLDHSTNSGDSGDPYSSDSFTENTYPNSLAYNGTESGWKIKNIETSGDNIIVDISSFSEPHAVADADEAVIAEGLELQFYGNESWDEDGNIVSYTWDFGDGEVADIDNPTHIFAQNGAYEVKLTVCDNHNLCDSMILSIFVNKPPISVVEISELIIMLGDTINFNASGSYDIDGDIEFYYWNFDDGYTSNQAIVDHEFKNSGFFNVSLKIIDNLNYITTTYYMIEVINRLPIVDFECSPSGGDTRIIFNFIDLSYDEDGENEEWLWNFGDDEDVIGKNVNHIFNLPGTYNVTLTVVDDQGGINSTNKYIIVENAPPEPNINIPEGLKIGIKQWSVPANKSIEIDGSVTNDNENDALTFFWTYKGNDYTGPKLNFIFSEGENEITLRVLDSRGDETTETFSITAEVLPLLTLPFSETNLVVNQEISLESSISWGQINLYKWTITDDYLNNIIYEKVNTNKTINFSFDNAGNYKLNISGRDVDTNLWTKIFPLSITVYNNPIASFTFNNNINEGDWITFNGQNSSGLDLEFKWELDGNILAGEDEIINVLIDYGGEHILKLTVNQNPVGIATYEVIFYADYKPTGILSTKPSVPRYGEDFEIYLAAYDVEGEASIEYLKITVYNENGDKVWEQLYNNQGSNFNVVFEMQYTGNIILDYKLADEKDNQKENVTSVEVLGWADIFIESFNIKGDKEKGKKQTLSIVLTNYNETYLSNLYNGHIAKGELELILNSEKIHSWTYEIDPNKSQEFNFEWTAIAGYHLFELITTVLEGEVIINNNYLNLTIIIESERESGFLNSTGITLTAIVITVTSIIRRKPN